MAFDILLEHLCNPTLHWWQPKIFCAMHQQRPRLLHEAASHELTRQAVVNWDFLVTRIGSLASCSSIACSSLCLSATTIHSGGCAVVNSDAFLISFVILLYCNCSSSRRTSSQLNPLLHKDEMNTFAGKRIGGMKPTGSNVDEVNWGPKSW